MKQSTTYICSFCGAEFKSEEECAACENGHKTPTEIVERRYVPIAEDTKGYPHTMCVKFNDGSAAVYKFCMLPKEEKTTLQN